jgi:galactokinase
MIEKGWIAKQFKEVFGADPRLYRAPGRVNLIGEHTDYNDGFVMPAALQASTWVAASLRGDRRIRVRSVMMAQTFEFDLDDGGGSPRHDWSDYVRGVATMIEDAGNRLRGADLLIASDVPVGAGLSSSAAIEVAVGFALMCLAGLPVDLATLARICQRAENEFVGMRCGIMDQFIACKGATGQVLMIDCRSLESRLVPVDARARLVVCNSMVHHELAGSEYNERRRDCETAVELLSQALPGIRALRDVTMDQLQRHAGLLPEIVFRRSRHVIAENDRVLCAADALAAGDLAACGRLMSESHVSMRDDYEISCREIDIMVDIAQGIPGTFGARMTGGGFGGSIVALVEIGAVDRFTETMARDYRAATNLTPVIFDCYPGAGVSEEALAA